MILPGPLLKYSRASRAPLPKGTLNVQHSTLKLKVERCPIWPVSRVDTPRRGITVRFRGAVQNLYGQEKESFQTYVAA